MNKKAILIGLAVLGAGYIAFGQKKDENTLQSNGLTRAEMTKIIGEKAKWTENSYIDFQRFSDFDVLQVYEADINYNFIAGNLEKYREMLKKYGWA